jgi:hypothetical protein
MDADAMLFAAGLAAGRRSKGRLWPAVCAVLIIQWVGLGAWAVSERSQRLQLANRLATDPPVAVPDTASDMAARSRYIPKPNDYFQQRRALEQGTSYFVASRTETPFQGVQRQTSDSAPLQAGQWDHLLESLD